VDIASALKNVVEPGLKLLPPQMDTPEARSMMLAIGMQESRFEYRKQLGGPANGFFQFEKGGGVAGVLRHHSTKDCIHEILSGLEINPNELYDAIVYHDPLASACARLLLWTDPHSLPGLKSDYDESWNLYLRTWRPGKPHRHVWNANRLLALEAI
jgi:hypothetical protein